MSKTFYCANCGQEIEESAYIFLDNYLQVKYFDDNKSNRFCCKDCACEALYGQYIDIDEIPLDDDEKESVEVEE